MWLLVYGENKLRRDRLKYNYEDLIHVRLVPRG